MIFYYLFSSFCIWRLLPRAEKGEKTVRGCLPFSPSPLRAKSTALQWM